MISQIMRQNQKIDKLNILSFCTHERYQGNLSNVNANFYLFRSLPHFSIRVKDWNYNYGDLPPNHFLLNPQRGLEQVPPWLTVDLLLSQTKAGQIQISRQLQQKYPVPIISLEHTLPQPSTSEAQLLEIKKHLSGDVNVFITEYNRDRWLYSPDESIVIYHGIDTELFKTNESKQRRNHVLTVANEYPTRNEVLNFEQYKKVTAGLPTCPVGDSPGFSKPASSIDELVNFYQTSRVFLNTAHISPIPMALLEAMACGCGVVSCKTAAIPEFIEHGFNGFLARNDHEMREYLEMLISDEDLALELGYNARETILEKCSMERFTTDWDNLLQKAINE